MPSRTEVIVGWLVLFGAALALLACVGVAAWWQRRREDPRRLQRVEHPEATRHAAMAAERAAQAAQRAGEARRLANAAEQDQAAAWEAVEQAQHAHDRAAQAYHAAAQRRVQRASDPAGQQELTHAAFAAYRRGDLSQDQLWSVWRWTSGWDEEMQRRERELGQLRVTLREARLHYRAAAGRARSAVAAADIAEVQARALAEEAAEAGADAGVTP